MAHAALIDATPHAGETIFGRPLLERLLLVCERAGVPSHRVVVLLGVGLIVWATPRLARRCGVAEVSALWLGAANPLLIMHLVAGIHNEAPMMGLMLTGTEFALRGVDSTRPLWPRPWPRASGDRADFRGYPGPELVRNEWANHDADQALGGNVADSPRIKAESRVIAQDG